MAFNRERALAAAAKYAAKGQHDRSAREYAAIVEDDPSDIRSWLMLADCLVRSGDREGAIGKYLKVAEHYVAIDESQKALAVFRQVLNLDPGRLEIHIKVAELYRSLGHIPDAVATYEFVAQSYFQSGKIAEGLDGFKRVAELDARAVGKRLRLAELYSREGMVKDAVEHFALAASRLLIDQRFDDYIRVAERLIYHKEDELPVLRTLARIYLKKNESRRALVKLNALLRAAPTDPVGLELLGDTFIALGRVNKAVSVVTELAREQRKAGKDGLEIAARVLRKAVSWEHDQVEAMQTSLAEVEAELAELRADEPEEDALLIDVSDVAADDEDGFDIDLDDSVDIEPEVSGPVTEQATKAHEEASGAQELAQGEEVAPAQAGPVVSEATEPREESHVDTSESSTPTDHAEPTSATPEVAEPEVAEPEVAEPAKPEAAEPEAYTAQQLEKILVEARVYVNYKMFEHALRHIRGVLAQEPEHREASELKAVILTDLKRDEDAVALYLELVARHRETDPEYALTLVAKALKIAPRNNDLQELRIALGEPEPEVSGSEKIASTPEPEDSKARAVRLGSVLRKVASRKQPEPADDSSASKLPRLSLGKRPEGEGSGSSSLPPLAATTGGRATSTDDSGQIRFRAPKPSRPHAAKPATSEVVELDAEEFEELDVEEVRTSSAKVPRPPPPRSLRGLPRRPGSKTTAKSSSKTSLGSSRLRLNLGSRKSQGQSKEPSSSPAKSDAKSNDDNDGDAGDGPGHASKSVATKTSQLPSKHKDAGSGASTPSEESNAPETTEAQTGATSEVSGEKGNRESPVGAPEEAAESPVSEVSGASVSQETGPAWSDIADEVDELAFFISQGFEDDARFTFMDLDQKHPGHPALEPFRVKFSSGVVLDAPVESPSHAGGQLSESTAPEAPAGLSDEAEQVPVPSEQVSGNADVGEAEQAKSEDPTNASGDPEGADVASQASAVVQAVGTQEAASVGAESAQPVADVENSDVSQPAADAHQVAATDTEDDAPTPESADEPVPGSEPDLAAASMSATQQLSQDSAAASIEPGAEEEESATGGEQGQVADSGERPERTRPGESPEDALDGLARADELEREAEKPEPEPEPEFEDFMLGDEDLEGDDFLTSIFALPEENTSVTSEDVKVPARARATIDASADARTLFDLGTAYREMGLVDDAITQFEMAAQDPAWTARSLVMMASLHLHRGETDKATADLEEAIGCASNDAERSEASYELGVVYQMVGNDAKARELFEAVGSGYRDRDERLASLKAE